MGGRWYHFEEKNNQELCTKNKNNQELNNEIIKWDDQMHMGGTGR